MAAGQPPSAPSPSSAHFSIPSQSQPIFQSGTYVVQIPKDQIYRVPPPQNAQFIEQHQNPRHQPQRPRRCSICSWFCCIVILAIIVIATGLALGLSFSFLEPKNPDFTVQSFVLKNSSSSQSHTCVYEITLRINNPNQKSDILYKEGGAVSLYLKQQKLAAAKFPNFVQNERTSNDIKIPLKGAVTNDASKTPTGRMSYSLKMEIPVRMKLGYFKTGDTELAMICDFIVDKLGKELKLLSEQCKANR